MEEEGEESPFDFRAYTAQEDVDEKDDEGSYQYFYTGGGGSRASGGRRRKGWMNVEDAFDDLFNTWKGYTASQPHNTTRHHRLHSHQHSLTASLCTAQRPFAIMDEVGYTEGEFVKGGCAGVCWMMKGCEAR